MTPLNTKTFKDTHEAADKLQCMLAHREKNSTQDQRPLPFKIDKIPTLFLGFFNDTCEPYDYAIGNSTEITSTPYNKRLNLYVDKTNSQIHQVITNLFSHFSPGYQRKTNGYYYNYSIGSKKGYQDQIVTTENYHGFVRYSSLVELFELPV